MADSTRERIAKAVLDLLSDGQPRIAREVVAILRMRNGLEDIDKRLVNSILYHDLAQLTEQDGEYRWVARPVQPGGTSSVSHPSASTTLAEPAKERSSLLRAIHRLRSGLPPSERLADLTVGAGGSVGAISSWLDAAPSHRRWLTVHGNYGEGKSHRLAMIRETAHERGFATCQLMADAASSALNHPQRFMPVLLSTLEVPGTPVYGYEHFLHELLVTSARGDSVAEVISNHLAGSRDLAVAEYVVTRIAEIGDGEDDEHQAQRAPLLWLMAAMLSGEIARHRGGTPAIRMQSYSLVRIAIDLVRLAGCRGLVLLVDEVESVFTKLPNIASRRGAYRVLAALCESQHLEGLRIALAITPDAHRQLLSELQSEASGCAALPCEPVERWVQALVPGGADILCRALAPTDRLELINRVRSTYERTYPGGSSIEGNPGWESLLRKMARIDMPVRLVVRETVDFLDARRYQSL